MLTSVHQAHTYTHTDHGFTEGVQTLSLVAVETVAAYIALSDLGAIQGAAGSEPGSSTNSPD